MSHAKPHRRAIAALLAAFSLALGCSSEPAPTPDTDLLVDAADDAQPSDADTQPEDAEEPSDADTQPEDAEEPSDADAEVPDADAEEPDADAEEPDADAEEPDADAEEPDADAEEPDADDLPVLITCTDDTDCDQGYCSNSACTPEGYVYLPPATYTRGAPPSERGFHSARENGQHTAVLTRGIFVKTTTVTQGEWLAVMGGSNPSFFEACGADCPVERVSWWEALAYANALSTAEGLDACYNLQDCAGRALGTGCLPTDRDGGQSCRGYYCASAQLATLDLDCNGYRLPTEAEWEYAARGGTSTAFLTASGELQHWGMTPLDTEMDAIAWYRANSDDPGYTSAYDCSTDPEVAIPCGTRPVAQKAPNAFGLYDITGNVWEMVWDWAGDHPEAGSTVTDPTGPTTGTARRMRGGTFDSVGQYLRVAYRTSIGETSRLAFIGFRLVRTAPPAQD